MESVFFFDSGVILMSSINITPEDTRQCLVVWACLKRIQVLIYFQRHPDKYISVTHWKLFSYRVTMLLIGFFFQGIFPMNNTWCIVLLVDGNPLVQHGFGTSRYWL